MPQLTYSLWYDDNAKEAVETYTRLFPDSWIENQTQLPETPSGDVDFLSFYLGDVRFTAMSAGNFFKLNESISIFVTVSSKEEVDRLYGGLSEGGEDLMPLQQYDFSDYYVWVRDRFGLTWQLSFKPDQEQSHGYKICLLFGGKQVGMAEPALQYYGRHLGLQVEDVQYYQDFPGKAEKAKVVYASASLFGSSLIFMDHGMTGVAEFNEAFSISLPCQNQDEIDRYWEVLSKVPEAEACGWCKDDVGLSWQIVPEQLEAATFEADSATLKEMQATYYPMKKFEIAPLEKYFKL